MQKSALVRMRGSTVCCGTVRHHILRCPRILIEDSPERLKDSMTTQNTPSQPVGPNAQPLVAEPVYPSALLRSALSPEKLDRAMLRALELAVLGPITGPNPRVGCVI